jgi:hypothetical protein
MRRLMLLLFLALAPAVLKAQVLQWKSLHAPRGGEKISSGAGLPDGSILVTIGRDYDTWRTFRSRDNGATWEFVVAKDQPYSIYSLGDSLILIQRRWGGVVPLDTIGFASVIPYYREGYYQIVTFQNAIVATNDTLIVYTTNKGRNWIELQLPLKGLIHSLQVGADGKLYLFTDDAIWRTSKIEGAWERYLVPSGLVVPSMPTISSSGHLYSSYKKFALRDGRVELVDSIGNFQNKWAASDRGGLYLIGDRVSRSLNDGSTWDTVDGIYGIDREAAYCFDSTDHLYLFSYDNYRVDVESGDWSPIYGPQSDAQTVLASDQAMIVSGYHHNGAEISDDHGETWRYMLPVSTRRVRYSHIGMHPQLGIWLLLNYADAGQGKKVDWYYILHSRDGEYWTQSDRIPGVSELRYLGTDSRGRIFLHDQAFGVSYSDESGLSWTSTSSALANAELFLTVGAESQGKLWIPGYRALITVDLNRPNEVVFDSSKYYFSTIASDQGGNLIAQTSGYGVHYRATDGKFYIMEGFPEGTQINQLVYLHDRWFAATDSGLFYSKWMHPSPLDITWHRCDETLIDKSVRSIAYDGQGRIYIGTAYSGAYFAEFGTAAVSEEGIDLNADLQFTCSSSHVSLSGVEPGQSASLFDLLGRRISHQATTADKIEFNITTLQAGIYFLTSGSRSYKFTIAR